MNAAPADELRLEAIGEAAELAAEFAAVVCEAAAAGDGLRIKLYAGLLARAVRNACLAAAELGATEVRA